MHIVHTTDPSELKKIMRDIDVDEYGIRIMINKAIAAVVRVNGVSNITANILKQEMLSCGGDVAVARGALTGRTRTTDCLLMGSLAHFNRLTSKLTRQPFGLGTLARELKLTLAQTHKDTFTLTACRKTIRFTGRPYIMGIINLTPDSFSGDGLGSMPPEDVVRYAQQLICEGADIIDIGGESTRPGAGGVSAKEELRRVIPALKALSKKIKTPISIDTSKPEVARAAFDAGASIVNDTTGLRQPAMRTIVARAQAGAVIMHMQGNPRTMQRSPVYASLIDDLLVFFRRRIDQAADSGISRQQLIIDPGIGFGKTLAHNLELIKHIDEFRSLGRPVLIGASRKSFIGKILNQPQQHRVFGTVSACLAAVARGAKIVRVHDVKAVKEALRVFTRINQA